MKNSKTAFKQLKQALLSDLLQHFNFPPAIKLWTRSNFVKAAKIYSKQLGSRSIVINNKDEQIDNYISSSTLERIFKYGYKLPNPIDKRRLNTLNKLAVCLGYESFGEYSFAIENDLNIDFKQLIINANIAEFEVYKNMPQINFDGLLPYYINNAPAYNQIYKVVNKLAAKGITLKDDKNPSYQEILEVEVLKRAATAVRIKTKECWYLKWHSKNENIDYYNESNTQLYLLDKTNEGWKIRINHYPYNFEN